ncbi:MAG: alcohol dehydrogenase catalytic domain-containing protein [Pseudomonadota bacterium]
MHIVDGDSKNPVFPMISVHEIVGRVTKIGRRVGALAAGQRVGIPWLGYT